MEIAIGYMKMYYESHMSNKNMFFLFFTPILFGGPGVALLYYVFYCIKKGSVSTGSKFGGHVTDYRKDDPFSFWAMILIYSTIGVGLLYLAVVATVSILKRNGYLH
jgi:hypothetical protein